MSVSPICLSVCLSVCLSDSLFYPSHLSVSDLSVFMTCLSQICPALNHAALVHVNSMLETIPVRTEVDRYIGIDYSLIDDPVVTSRSLDMNFRVKQ